MNEAPDTANDLSTVWRSLQDTIERIQRKPFGELTPEEKRTYQIAISIDRAWREAAK